MIYEYICEKCGYKTDVELSINHKHPKRLPCLKCKEDASMYRNFGRSTIYVPLAFKDNTYNFEKRAKRKFHSFQDKH